MQCAAATVPEITVSRASLPLLYGLDQRDRAHTRSSTSYFRLAATSELGVLRVMCCIERARRRGVLPHAELP